MVFEGTSRPESMPDTETTFRRWSDGDVVGIDAQQVDGTTFGGILSVVADGGSRTSTEGTISFTSATSATLVLGIACGRAERVRETTFLESWSKRTIDYDDMLARHRREHQRLMSTFDLTIGGDSRTGWTARTRRRPPIHPHRPSSSSWPHSVGICSSRAHGPGMARESPRRLERGLRAGLVVGLPQRRERSADVLAGTPRRSARIAAPSVRLSREPLDDYRANARRVFGCGGIVIPICQSTHGLVFPERWVNWTGAAGWIAPVLLPVLGVHPGSHVPGRTRPAVHAGGRLASTRIS